MSGGEWLTGTLVTMLVLVGVTMAIIYFSKDLKDYSGTARWYWGRCAYRHIFRFRCAKLVIWRQLKVLSFHVPMVDLSWETFEIIFPYAVILAAMALSRVCLHLTWLVK